MLVERNILYNQVQVTFPLTVELDCLLFGV